MICPKGLFCNSTLDVYQSLRFIVLLKFDQTGRRRIRFDLRNFGAYLGGGVVIIHKLRLGNDKNGKLQRFTMGLNFTVEIQTLKIHLFHKWLLGRFDVRLHHETPGAVVVLH